MGKMACVFARFVRHRHKCLEAGRGFGPQKDLASGCLRNLLQKSWRQLEHGLRSRALKVGEKRNHNLLGSLDFLSAPQAQSPLPLLLAGHFLTALDGPSAIQNPTPRVWRVQRHAKNPKGGCTVAGKLCLFTSPGFDALCARPLILSWVPFMRRKREASHFTWGGGTQIIWVCLQIQQAP